MQFIIHTELDLLLNPQHNLLPREKEAQPSAEPPRSPPTDPGSTDVVQEPKKPQKLAVPFLGRGN